MHIGKRRWTKAGGVGQVKTGMGEAGWPKDIYRGTGELYCRPRGQGVGGGVGVI